MRALRYITYLTILIFFMSILVLGATLSFADKYVTRQITDNADADYAPSLYNGTIAWYSDVDGDNDIYYWDGTSTTNITNNLASDTDPSLYDGSVAWHGDIDGDYEIYYWDGTNTIQVSEDVSIDYAPSLYDGEIAWKSSATQRTHYWDGATVTQFYDNGTGETYPSLYNGQIAWQESALGANSTIYEAIFYWNGTSTTVLDRFTSTSHNRVPSLYDGTIAWRNESGYDIWYWDGTNKTRVTNNSSYDNNPSLYNGQIAWNGNVDGDYEIYFWDGSSITKITDNTASDSAASLYNGEIAWVSDVDGDSEIYYARLASAWIRDALPEINIWESTENEILELADMYTDESSGIVGDRYWTYLSGDLPGDTDGEVYEIGDSWIFEGKYYIKLGSGLQGTGAPVPEVPMPEALVLLLSFFVLRRKRLQGTGAKCVNSLFV